MTLESIDVNELETTGDVPSLTPIEMLDGTNSIVDIYDRIIDTGIVRGSSRDYEPVEVIERIDNALRNIDPDTGRITRSGGIREAVGRVVSENEDIQGNVLYPLKNGSMLGVRSVGDLYARVLAHGRFTTSSGRVLSTHEMLERVESVRKGESDIETITRTDGLRDALKGLLSYRP